MKILKIIIVAFFMLTFFVSKASSDCPEGYESGQFDATYSYNNGQFTCHLTIHYCCKWNNTTKSLDFEIDYLESNSQCLYYIHIPNWTDFINWLHEVIINQATEPCTPDWPPCDDPIQVYYFYSHTFICNYYENKNISHIPSDPAYHLFLKKCQGSVECVTKWKVCYDYNYNPAKLTKTVIDRYTTGTPGCNDVFPTLPPSGKTWEQEWSTECFSKPCQ